MADTITKDGFSDNSAVDAINAPVREYSRALLAAAGEDGRESGMKCGFKSTFISVIGRGHRILCEPGTEGKLHMKDSTTMAAVASRIALMVFATLTAFVLAAPADADPSDQDRRFISALKSIGWSIYDADILITKAHMVCNEGLEHGVTWQEMRSSLTNDGYSKKDASSLISNAVTIYCPSHSDVVAEIQRDTSGGASAGGIDDLFVQRLKDLRISMDKGAAVDMAKTACQSPITGVGLYNAWQAMQKRYPEYSLNTVSSVMGQGVLAYCPGRLQ